ncbi:MAG: hypothetical protein WC483_02075 [Candidatus Paceibacterota bacterium]|nr:hypothetical protein [Candidatus Paceibacterota bacterium]
MQKKKFIFKKDHFKSARGGHSRLLEIHCRKCENIIAFYQKDGPGELRRMYMDRIFEPAELAKLQSLDIKDIPVLKCNKCKEILGTPYIYMKEKRKAYRLYQDAIIKKLKKIS